MEIYESLNLLKQSFKYIEEMNGISILIMPEDVKQSYKENHMGALPGAEGVIREKFIALGYNVSPSDRCVRLLRKDEKDKRICMCINYALDVQKWMLQFPYIISGFKMPEELIKNVDEVEPVMFYISNGILFQNDITELIEMVGIDGVIEHHKDQEAARTGKE